MDKDFLFETNRQNDLANRAHASGTGHQDTDTSTVAIDATDRRSQQPMLAMVEFGSGWYHAAAVKHALKA